MKKYLLLSQILLGIILSYFIISRFFSGNQKFENFALGTSTVQYNAIDANRNLMHISKANNEELASFLKGYDERGKKNVLLFLGNSQTHSINQKKEGEVNFIELLNLQNQKKENEVLCFSIPNANLEEFYVSFQYLNDKLKIKELIIPIFFDDLREEGIRDVFFTKLFSDHFLVSDTNLLLNKKVNKVLRSYRLAYDNPKNSENNSSDLKALKETVQESVEKKLNEKLSQTLPAWNNRTNVRGDFFVWLYKLRNTLLGIKATTIRDIIPEKYKQNLSYLDLMIRECLQQKIKVVLYIPPIRSDVQIPYSQYEYKNFKKTIAAKAETNPKKVLYLNFEKIIPGYLWGYKEATNLIETREIDFMHFQFKGHQILADSLSKYIEIN